MWWLDLCDDPRVGPGATLTSHQLLVSLPPTPGDNLSCNTAQHATPTYDHNHVAEIVALMGKRTCSQTELGQGISAPLSSHSLLLCVSISNIEEYRSVSLFVQTATQDGNHCYSSHSG